MNEENDTGSVRIRDMPWADVLKLLRSIGPEVGRLMQYGDPTAKMLMAYYIYAHSHPNDKKANLNVRAALEDYVSRDLRLAERTELGGKYGHRLPEPEKEHGPRIVVPDTVRVQ